MDSHADIYHVEMLGLFLSIIHSIENYSNRCLFRYMYLLLSMLTAFVISKADLISENNCDIRRSSRKEPSKMNLLGWRSKGR